MSTPQETKSKTLRTADSIRTKIVLIFSAIVLCGFSGVIAIITVRTGGSLATAVYQYVNQTASRSASELSGSINLEIAKARAVGQALEGIKQEGATRKTAIALLGGEFASDKAIGGIWAVFEPDAWDGLDQQNQQAAGSAPNGRFAPYWNRFSGKDVLEAAVDFDNPGDNGLYYRAPFTSAADFVTEPTTYDIAGAPTTVVSVCTPIISQGSPIGVSGIDLSMTAMVKLVTGIKPFERGYAYLVSGSGGIVAHPDTGLVSKKLGDILPETQREPVNQGIAGQADFNVMIRAADGEEWYLAFAPLFFGDNRTPWYLVVAIPTTIVNGPVDDIKIMGVVVALVAIALIVMTILLLVGAMLRPIDQARDALLAIAAGEADLTAKIVVKRRDEIGIMVEGFNDFVGKLRTIIARLKDANQSLSSMGDQLASSATETAAAVHEISTNVESVQSQTTTQMSSVTQVSTAVTEIARNIESLEGLVEHQSEGVTHASASIEQMVGNIDSVSKSIQRMSGEFDSLIKDSDSGKALQDTVSTKVGVISSQSDRLMEANTIISSIAAQTNLLAMNAAIEAAHAGDSGRGFSVVADEIRKLAETAATQSHEIASELKEIQKSIQEVVQAAGLSGEAFNTVAGKINAIGGLMREIGQAMNEQTEGSHQILEALRSMNEITRQVREGSKEMTIGNSLILGEMESLRHISISISGSMQEMTQGAENIASASAEVSTLAADSRQLIHEISTMIGNFKT